MYAANAFEAESPWMLGDWNGQRSALQQKATTLALAIRVKWQRCSMPHILQVIGTEYADQFAFGTHSI